MNTEYVLPFSLFSFISQNKKMQENNLENNREKHCINCELTWSTSRLQVKKNWKREKWNSVKKILVLQYSLTQLVTSWPTKTVNAERILTDLLIYRLSWLWYYSYRLQVSSTESCWNVNSKNKGKISKPKFWQKFFRFQVVYKIYKKTESAEKIFPQKSTWTLFFFPW